MGSRRGALVEVREYSDIHRAMRARAEELNLSRLTIDDIAGTPEGYASKVLAPQPMKCAGHKSLLPLLGALALKLVIVEDPDALAQITQRMKPADRERQRLTTETTRQREQSRWVKHRDIGPQKITP
jgi:hypothetical protein